MNQWPTGKVTFAIPPLQLPGLLTQFSLFPLPLPPATLPTLPQNYYGVMKQHNNSDRNSSEHLALRVASLVLITAATLGVDQCQQNYNLDPKSRAGGTTTTTSGTGTTTSTLFGSVTTTTLFSSLTTTTTSSSVTTTTEDPDLGAILSPSGSDDESSDDSGLDSDSDGLTDAEEGEFGTQKNNPDSDSDGFTDGFEVENGFSPSDPASHPLIPFPLSGTVAEQRSGVGDSDGDGLTDLYEEEVGLNPDLGDTDGDGVSDGSELLNGTDARSSDTSFFPDSDGDSLTDQSEARLGTSPQLADTDRDGLDDERELLLGFDPRSPDSDGNGLIDSWESRAPKYRFAPAGFHF